MLKLILLVASATIFIFILILISILILRHKFSKTPKKNDIEINSSPAKKNEPTAAAREELTTFEGGEDLTIHEILEAPGEVVGKSHYGTLYKASLQRTRLLRFLRPAASAAGEDCGGGGVVEIVGSIRHRNLVPMVGFYAGGRGERLLVYPFYEGGNLAHFITDGGSESKNWETIYKITLGMAKALNHLHHGLPEPVPHGNLKPNNVLLDRNLQPLISDPGLHLLLSAAATQKMLQLSAAAGYNAPELLHMADADERTDVYSFGKILLELLSANPAASGGDGGDWSEGRNLRGLFRIGEDCCSWSPMNRPGFEEVIARIEEIGRVNC